MSLTLTVTMPNLPKLQAALARAPQEADRQLRGAMEASVAVAHAEIARRTPVDTGLLRGATFTALQGSPATGMRGIVANPLAYAPHVEFGTRAHDIRPRNAQALRFSVNGQTRFARRVRHPGTKGVFMFRDGLKAAAPRIEGFFRQAAERVIAAVARGAR